VKTWFAQKTASEQTTILVLAGISFWCLSYAFIYLPIARNMEDLRNKNTLITSEIQQMQILAQQLATVTATPVTKVKVVTNIMSVVDKITQQQQLTASINSKGKDQVVVQFKQANFNAVMRWLAILTTDYPLKIIYLAAEKNSDGSNQLKIILSQ